MTKIYEDAPDSDEEWVRQMNEMQQRIKELEAALRIITRIHMTVPQAEWPQHYYQRQLYAAKDAAMEALRPRSQQHEK